MQQIKLTGGLLATVDDKDYDDLNKYKWHYNGFYAVRGEYLGKVAPHKYKHTTVKMHRQIMEAPAGLEVDHINGDRLDNRRSNLRLATRKQNSRNTKPRGISKYKGLNWRPERSKWLVRITTDEKRLHVGYFTDEMEAAKAYDKHAIKYHGDYARLNFKQGVS